MPSLSTLLSAISFRLWRRPDHKKRKSAPYYPYAVYRQTTMLSILREPDTTRHLLEFILDTPSGRRSVSRLARTCKALCDPGLNVLWKELDSINPLLSTMPSNLFKRAKRPGLGFAKMPEERDWKRLLAYGERVRKIAYNETAGNVSPSIFSVIEDYRPQDFILPNLTSLAWRAETPEGLERSLLFLIPNLQCVSVEIGSRVPQEDLEEFLTEIATIPNLSTLSIDSSTRIPGHLPDLLREQGSLLKVALSAPGALSPTIGRWLSSMTTLRSLQLDVTGRSETAISAFFDQVPKSGTSSPDARTPDSGVFSSDELDSSSWGRAKGGKHGTLDTALLGGFHEVRHLNLTGEAVSITTFLGRLTMPLQHLELVLEDPNDESDWKALCFTIHKQFRDSLLSLQVTASGSSKFTDLIRSTPRGETASRRLPLDSLVSLPNLARLEIDLPESIMLHDADMAHLASACPNLEMLKLCAVSRWPVAYGPPKLSLGGLAPLTATCKQLHTLAIPIHGIPSSDNNVFDRATSSRSLLRLHVGHSWVSDPLQAAILLSHLSPHLETLRWFHEKNRPGYIEANNVGWQKVSETLPFLQELRLHERRQTQVVPVEKPPSTVDRRVDTVKKVTYTSRGVLVKPSTADFSVDVRPSVTHQSIQVEHSVCSREVDATPETRHQEVEAVPLITHHAVDTRDLVFSRLMDAATMTTSEPIEVMAPMDIEELEDLRAPSGSTLNTVGSTFRSLYLGVRSISPPILLRLFDMWSMFTLDTARVFSDDMTAGMRSPILFSSKISPPRR